MDTASMVLSTKRGERKEKAKKIGKGKSRCPLGFFCFKG